MRDKILLKCLFVSVAVHAAIVGLFLFQPLHLSQSKLATLKKTAPKHLEEDELTILKKELALQEAMQDLIMLPSQARLPHDIRRQLPPEDDSATIDETPLILTNRLILPQLETPLPLPLSEPTFSTAAPISAT
jgi:hypothetical protein